MARAGDPWLEIDRVRQQRGQVAENSTRVASAYITHTTHGSGEIAVARVRPFGCTFIQEPRVYYGWVLIGAATLPADQDDEDYLVDTRFPRVSGGVYRWQIDARGYYIGAWLCFAVDTTAPIGLSAAADPGYELRHHFKFEGLAVKDLPEELLDL